MSGSTSKKKGAAAADPNSSELAKVLESIPVGGLTPFTTIDFPGRLAGVFYLQGCPWRCRYCYNSEFFPFPPAGHRVPPEKIRQYLESRRKNLDGIIFSGGEPTAHADLKKWLEAVKSLGYEIGLHTNGMFPDRLKGVLPVCSWVGMDIKAPFKDYEKITLVPKSGEPAKESLKILAASGVPFECRTTVHPDLLSENEILVLAKEIAAMGCKHFAVQMFHAENCPDKELRESDATQTGISINLRDTLVSIFSDFSIRK